MDRRTLPALVLLASVLAGCGGDDEAATDDATTTTAERSTTTTEASTTTTTEAAGAAEVTLLDPGAEPRQALRFAVEEGATDAVTQRNELQIVQEIGGQTQEVALPATEVDVDYVAQDVGDDRFTAVGSYGATRVDPGDPAVVAEVERLFAQLADAGVATELTTRGAVLGSEVQGLDQTGNPVFDQLASSLVDQASSLSFPFPEEPVGVGARWEVTSSTELSGLPIEIRYLVTVTSLDGPAVAADVESTLRFVPGEVDIQGTRAEVLDGELTGVGTVSWDLEAGLVPRLALENAGTVTIDVGGTRLVQRQTQRSALTSRG